MSVLLSDIAEMLTETDNVHAAVVYRVDALGRSEVGSRGVSPESTFRIASCTKTFTAATVLRLGELGVLGLDDDVRRHLPAERTGEVDLASISVRHLLSHTSGLPDLDGEWFMKQLFNNPGREWTPWEKIALSLEGDRGPVGPPARYCDVGYILLAMLIEHLTGRPLAQAFRSLLRFADLGLATIHLESLEPTPVNAGPRVRHFIADRDVTDIHPSCDLWGAGGLVSDAHDLAHWWHALFAGEVFDRGDTLLTMLTANPEPSAGRDMALGLYRRTIAGHEVWAHGGYWGTYPFHDRTTGTTAAIMLDQCLDYAGPNLGLAVAQVLGLAG